MPREAAVDNSIKREVSKRRNTFVQKYHGNPMTRGGHTDLYGVIPIHYADVIIEGRVVRARLARPIGAAFFIESKQPGKTSTPRQSSFQRRIAKTAAVVGEAHSWEEAAQILAPLLELNEG